MYTPHHIYPSRQQKYPGDGSIFIPSQHINYVDHFWGDLGKLSNVFGHLQFFGMKHLKKTYISSYLTFLTTSHLRNGSILIYFQHMDCVEHFLGDFGQLLTFRKTIYDLFMAMDAVHTIYQVSLSPKTNW